jgi:hypothetical protein
MHGLYRTRQLNLKTSNGSLVPHTVFEPNGELKGRAVVWPGQGVPADAPVTSLTSPAFAPFLVHTTDALLQQGYAVVRLEVFYGNNREFMAFSEAAQLTQVGADVDALWDGLRTSDFEPSILVGKSLGSFALGQAAVSHAPNARFVALTPALRFVGAMERFLQIADRSLFVIGDKDPHFEDSAWSQLGQRGARLLKLDGVNHSFEKAADVVEAAVVQIEVVRAVRVFVS